MTAGILNRFVRRQLCQQVAPVKTNHPQQYDMLPMESWPDSSKTGNHCYTKRNDGAPIVVRVRDQSFYVITADIEKVKVINDQSEAEQHVKQDEADLRLEQQAEQQRDAEQHDSKQQD